MSILARIRTTWSQKKRWWATPAARGRCERTRRGSSPPPPSPHLPKVRRRLVGSAQPWRNLIGGGRSLRASRQHGGGGRGKLGVLAEWVTLALFPAAGQGWGGGGGRGGRSLALPRKEGTLGMGGGRMKGRGSVCSAGEEGEWGIMTSPGGEAWAGGGGRQSRLPLTLIGWASGIRVWKRRRDGVEKLWRGCSVASKGSSGGQPALRTKGSPRRARGRCWLSFTSAHLGFSSFGPVVSCNPAFWFLLIQSWCVVPSSYRNALNKWNTSSSLGQGVIYFSGTMQIIIIFRELQIISTV